MNGRIEWQQCHETSSDMTSMSIYLEMTGKSHPRAWQTAWKEGRVSPAASFGPSNVLVLGEGNFRTRQADILTPNQTMKNWNINKIVLLYSLENVLSETTIQRAALQYTQGIFQRHLETTEFPSMSIGEEVPAVNAFALELELYHWCESDVSKKNLD